MNTKKELKEKDMVNYIIEHWDKLFKDIGMHFQKKEWQALPEYRADILAYTDINLKDIEYTKEDFDYRASVILECKWQSSERDLIYELKKAIYIKNYIERFNRPVYIGVLSDDYSDSTINDFLLENNIICFQVDIRDNNLDTMEINLLT